MKRTRLLLLDDHTLFRGSLARLLEFEPDFEVVGLCGKASEAHDLLRVSAVDVILLDFDLGEQQGNAFLVKARHNGYSGRVLVVTAGIRETDAALVLQRGVSGVFLKHDSPDKLVQAIRLVAAGGVWLNPELLQTIANKTNQPPDHSEGWYSRLANNRFSMESSPASQTKN